jgi:hypothetical protein
MTIYVVLLCSLVGSHNRERCLPTAFGNDLTAEACESHRQIHGRPRQARSESGLSRAIYDWANGVTPNSLIQSPISTSFEAFGTPRRSFPAAFFGFFLYFKAQPAPRL